MKKKAPPIIQSGRPSRNKEPQSLSDLAIPSDLARINFTIDRATHKKLKIHAAMSDKTISEFLRSAIEELLSAAPRERG